MSEKVMVAVDSRGISTSVVAWLAERGKSATSHLEIEVVTVAEVGWIPAGTADADYRNVYEQALFKAVAAVRVAVPGAAVAGTLLWGIPVEQLVNASSRTDLLVLGSDKTGVVAAFISGTVPLRVVAHSACPTVVVPAGWQPGARAIVVGVALESSDDTVLEFAATEAERTDSALIVVHALPIPQALLASDFISPVTIDGVRELHERTLVVTVAELAARHPAVTISTQITDTAAVLALVREAHSASLVVVGTHGRGVLRRLALGSVSHDLLLNAPCPVAVVRNGEATR